MKTTDLEIIILSYNSEFWLRKTLDSLKEEYLDKTKKSVKVTVVDNHSSDNTAAILKKDYRWVNSILLEQNVGFAAANNVAIERSTARYVMLLNSDVESTEQSNLDELIHYMDEFREVGIISPKLQFSNGQLDPACHRGEPTPLASMFHFLKLSQWFPKSALFGRYHQTFKVLDTVHEIDACSGAAMLVRQSAIQTVGLLDERFFMYAEDLDWCKRFRSENFKIIFFPFVSMIHHKYKSGIKGTSKKIAITTRKHFYDTMLQYYDKHYRSHFPSWVRWVIKYFVVIKKGAI